MEARQSIEVQLGDGGPRRAAVESYGNKKPEWSVLAPWTRHLAMTDFPTVRSWQTGCISERADCATWLATWCPSLYP